jgi:outer membrane protein
LQKQRIEYNYNKQKTIINKTSQNNLMNKIKILLMAAVLVFTSATAMGQKTGYISLDQVIGIMPEVVKIDTLMQKYQRDTINTEFSSLIEQYNYKDSILTKTDTTKMPTSLRKQYRTDLEGIAYQVQNWQSISQQAYQAKQGTLLQPIYAKVLSAIQAVAKEKGYTYVYDKSVLVIAPNGDDLLPAVAQKLNIKVPPNAQVGLR